jgi:hypothetical protein
MMMDLMLRFSAAQTVTASAASTYFYDQFDGTSNTTTFTPSPPEIFSVNRTYFGEDLGIGKGLGTPRIVVNTGTVFATLTSLQVQFRGAPENSTAHASGLRSDLSFVIYIETDAIPLALLTASTRIASFDWPMRRSRSLTVAAEGLPRFVDLNYNVGGSNATTGTITSDVTLGEEDAQGTLQLYGSNYKVAA